MSKFEKITRGSGGGGQPSTPEAPVSEPDTLFSDDIVEFTLGICEGPIGGLYEGPRSFQIDDTPLINSAGARNFAPFELHMYHGDATATPVKNALGGTSSNSQVGVPLATNTPVTRQTPVSLRNQIDRLDLRFQIAALSRSEEDGDVRGATLEFLVLIKPANESVWRPIYGNDGKVSLTGKTSGYVKEFSLAVPRINTDWDIQVTKITDDSDSMLQASLTWESFQSVTVGAKAYDNVAVIRGLGRASEQFGNIPNFTGVYATKVIKVPSNYYLAQRFYAGLWDGTFKEAVCDNPAWILYDLLMNEDYGFKRYYPDLQVDRFSFYEAAKWCDELVPRPAGGFQPRWTFNGAFTAAQNALEALSFLAGVMGGVLVSDFNGMVRLKVDRPSPIAQIFGPESVTVDGFQYQQTPIEQRSNDVIVRFQNPFLDWNQDQRRVFDQDSIDAHGRIEERLIAPGCIDVYEAQRRGQRRLLQANTETTTVSFRTTRAGLQLEPFDTIGITDPEMNWAVSGRVKSRDGNIITLRDPILLPVATPLTMSLQTNSTVQELTVRSNSAQTTELEIISGSWPADVPTSAQFALSSPNTGLVKPFRILDIQEDGETSEMLTVTALEVNTNKYGDVDNLTMSDSISYASRLAGHPAQPQITSVISGPDAMRTTAEGVRIPRMRISWSYEAGSAIEKFVVFIRSLDDEISQRFETKVPTIEIETIIPGIEYEITVVAINIRDRASPAATPVRHTVQGYGTAPTLPSGAWVGIPGIASITISGPEPTIADFSHYVAVRYDANDVEIGRERFSGTTYTRTIRSDDLTVYYRIILVNLSGFASPPTEKIFVEPRPIVDQDLSEALDKRITDAREQADAAQASYDSIVGAYEGTLVDFESIDAAIDTATQSALSDKTAAEAAAANAQTAQALAEQAQTSVDASEVAAISASVYSAASNLSAAMNQVYSQESSEASEASRIAAELAETISTTARDAAELAETNAVAAKNLAETARTAAEAQASSASQSASLAASARDSALEALALSGPTFLDLPETNWTTESTTGTAGTTLSAASSADFVSGDTDFGGCYEFPDATSRTIGQASGYPWSPGMVFEVEVEFRVVNDGTAGAGVRTQIGSNLRQSTTIVQADQVAADTIHTISDGVIIQRVWFYGRPLANMPTLPADLTGSKEISSAPANTFHPHLRQNAGSTTDGKIRVERIVVRDVTQYSDVAVQTQASFDHTVTAGASATAAEQSANAAETARLAAETAQSSAETAETNAATSQTDATGSASAAATSATTAAGSATAAGQSASAAAGSATTASSSATDAAQSATSAQTAQTAAETAQGAAQASEAATATSETNAAGSASSAATSASNAATSETNAGISATAASSSASSASTSATEAGTSATAANSAKIAAESAKGAAEISETNAATSATNASGSETAAAASAALAVSARNDAGDSASAASSSASAAGSNATSAGTSATAANSAKILAQSAEGNAKASETAAGISETNAAGSESAAASSAALAVSARNDAAGSATAASNSASSASSSATAAGTSATAADSARIAAESAEAAAGVSETNSAASETNAAGSASSASASASLAAASRNAADDAASAAATSATAAGTSATDAGTSATVANSAKLDAESARNAAGVSETNAATSETNASGSAGSAASSATLAATAKNDAAASAAASASSASAASASETAAGQSASAANASKIDAALARTGAEAAETSAIAAKQDAESASSSATEQRTLTVTAANQTMLDQVRAGLGGVTSNVAGVRVSGNFDFTSGLAGWQSLPGVNLTNSGFERFAEGTFVGPQDSDAIVENQIGLGVTELLLLGEQSINASLEETP